MRTVWFRTAFTGDKTTVIPPDGGIATTKTVNARDQLTRMQQYTSAPTLTGSLTGGFTAGGGTSHDIEYAYTAAGHQATVTGPDGSVWSYGYDLRGRQTSRIDPDTGSSNTAYDDAGNITLTRDARGIQLAFTYDLSGRKLTAVNKSKSNFKYAAWTYDTLRIGKLTSSTRYVSGVTGGYTVAYTGYSTLGNPLGQTISLPSVEKPLPLSYTTALRYTSNNELLAQQDDPAVGGLPGETITYKYNPLGAPTKTSGIDLYVAGTVYTDFGQPSRTTAGASTNEAQVHYAYDEHTLRLSGRSVYRSQGIGPLVDEIAYDYDQAGNALSVTNKQAESGNIVTDAQCYRYDRLARLVQAWTAKDACPAASTGQPDSGTASAAAGSYWQSFAYSPTGERTQLVEHSTSGGADRTTDYTSGCRAGCNRTGAQPHTLTQTTGGADAAKFVYDVAGNLLTRTPAAGTDGGQTLKWDDEGSLAEVVAAVGSTSTTTKYLYDADGNQLIRRDPGSTTLFAGDTQVVINTAVTPAADAGAMRVYTHGGGGAAVAMRSTLPDGGTKYLFNDPHGTATLAMDTTTQQVSRQQYKPYGEQRTSANLTLWPDKTRGYLGAPKDIATGYTDLGARKYDPALGRFISADPILDVENVNQMGGYAYGNGNPITNSDPTGLIPEEVANGLITQDEIDSIMSGSGSTSGGGGGSKGGSGSGGINVGANTKTGTRTRPPKFAEYAIIVTGHCLGFHPGLAHDCHISDLDAGEVSLAFAKYACEYYNDCTMRETMAAASDHESLEMMSMIPYLGIPATVELAKESWDKGEYASVAIQAASLLPWGKVVAKAGGKVLGKFGKSCNSFSGDTKVLMADGSTKAIAHIEIGDRVVATDPVTGETAAKPVTHLHNNLDTDLADLIVTDSGGVQQVVHTTQNHRFWNASTKQWTETDELGLSHRLGTRDGTAITIASVIKFATAQHMRDLTIADTHTYYVLAGNTPVLVHNDDGFDWDAAEEELTNSWDPGAAEDDGYHAPRGNQAENKQFEDALQEIKRRAGRDITSAERRALHDRITGQGYDYHRIVSEGEGLFGSCG
jgi:RHS repeat-associated protein